MTGAMRSTGLSDSAYWISYWVHAVLISVVSSAVVYIVGVTIGLELFTNSEGSLLYVILLACHPCTLPVPTPCCHRAMASLRLPVATTVSSPTLHADRQPTQPLAHALGLILCRCIRSPCAPRPSSWPP